MSRGAMRCVVLPPKSWWWAAPRSIPQLLDRADRLEITEVHATPEGDAFLTQLLKPDPAQWSEVARVENVATDADSAGFTYATYTPVAALTPFTDVYIDKYRVDPTC